MTNHLILPKILNVMDIRDVLLSWFTKFLIKNLLLLQVQIDLLFAKEQELIQISKFYNLQKNCTTGLLGNLKYVYKFKSI